MSARHVVTFPEFGAEAYSLFLRAKAVPEYAVELDENGFAHGVSMPARFAHLLGTEVESIDMGWQELPSFLMVDQDAIVRLALDAERFACWSDCGLGKTLIELEFARQVATKTQGRVLIITLSDVVEEIVKEARKFYGDSLPIRILRTRAEMRAWCGNMDEQGVAITNYEKMNPDGGPETQVVQEMKLLVGIVLDESSRLKTGGGKQKWALIKSAKGIRYKLSCTATPAPNEVMEFASQAAFLERIRGEAEVMWTYFTRDPVTNEWTVKEHARPHFFRWMASWSIYVRDPAAYGWQRNVPPVPEPSFVEHRIPATRRQREMAFTCAAGESGANATTDLFIAKSHGFVERGVLSQVAKGFRYRPKKEHNPKAHEQHRQTDPIGGANQHRRGERNRSGIGVGQGTRTEPQPNSGKRQASPHGSRGASERNYDLIESWKPGFVASIIAGEVADGEQVLVWCIFDAEVELLAEELEERGLGVSFRVISGKTTDAEREEIIAGFRDGSVRVLVSKASMLGFGFNFQHCGAMVFSGFSDSFELFYQAVRRAYRFGQTRSLRVHLPYVPECEEAVLRNVLRKAAQFEQLIREMERAYVEAMEGLKLKQAA